jgi:hypothetical protein
MLFLDFLVLRIMRQQFLFIKNFPASGILFQQHKMTSEAFSLSTRPSALKKVGCLVCQRVINAHDTGEKGRGDEGSLGSDSLIF